MTFKESGSLELQCHLRVKVIWGQGQWVIVYEKNHYVLSKKQNLSWTKMLSNYTNEKSKLRKDALWCVYTVFYNNLSTFKTNHKQLLDFRCNLVSLLEPVLLLIQLCAVSPTWAGAMLSPLAIALCLAALPTTLPWPLAASLSLTEAGPSVSCW